MARRYSEFANRIDIDALEDALEIDFIDNDGKGNDVGYCPDPWNQHKNGDTTGKFAIHRDKRLYNCWVCGGGTLLDLTMAIRDIGEEAAIEWLLQFVKEQSNDVFEDEIEGLLAADERSRNPIFPWFNSRVLDRWEDWTQELDEWLLERRITEKTALEHRISYAPNYEKISNKGVYQGPGIVFPHFWGDRLVGWQVRMLDPERPKWVPKYINTKDFPKEHTIYNYEAVYFSKEPLVVVESIPTVLFLEGLGVPAMATFGGSVTAEQMRLLRRCQQGVILAPDNDYAGTKFRTSVTEYLDKYIPVKVCDLVGEEGSGNDLADLGSDQEVLDHIHGAKDLEL